MLRMNCKKWRAINPHNDIRVSIIPNHKFKRSIVLLQQGTVYIHLEYVVTGHRVQRILTDNLHLITTSTQDLILTVIYLHQFFIQELIIGHKAHVCDNSQYHYYHHAPFSTFGHTDAQLWIR